MPSMHNATIALSPSGWLQLERFISDDFDAEA